MRQRNVAHHAVSTILRWGRTRIANVNIVEIDHSESEVRLHRAYYLLVFIRVTLLNLVLVVLALVAGLAFGLHGVYPAADSFLASYNAVRQQVLAGGDSLEADWFQPIEWGIQFAITIAVSWWIYTSITDVRPRSLRTIASLTFAGVFFFPGLVLFTFVPFFRQVPEPFIIALGIGWLILLLTASVDLARNFRKIADLRETYSLNAALDRKLAPTFWTYCNKLLDLPRSPLSNWRSVLSYLVSLASAVLFVVCLLYVTSFGSIYAEMTRIGVSCKLIVRCYAMSEQLAFDIAVWLVIALAGLRVAALLRSGARYFGALSIPEVLSDRNKPFVLYLRPFDTDGIVLPKPSMPFFTRFVTFRPFPASIEEELFDVADGYRPLVAIGKPGATADAARRDLAHRVFLTGEEWRPYVRDLIQRSTSIAMVLRATSGVIWELERILESDAVRKTLFFFDPSARDPARAREIEDVVLPHFRAHGIVPPDFTFAVQPIAFAIRKTGLVVFTNRHWTASSYRTAFSTFLSERDVAASVLDEPSASARPSLQSSTGQR